MANQKLKVELVNIYLFINVYEKTYLKINFIT